MDRYVEKTSEGYKLADGYTVEAVMSKLHRYEELGLTPNQLKQIDELYREKCEELANLRGEIYSLYELVKEKFDEKNDQV